MSLDSPRISPFPTYLVPIAWIFGPHILPNYISLVLDIKLAKSIVIGLGGKAEDIKFCSNRAEVYDSCCLYFSFQLIHLHGEYQSGEF